MDHKTEWAEIGNGRQIWRLFFLSPSTHRHSFFFYSIHKNLWPTNQCNSWTIASHMTFNCNINWHWRKDWQSLDSLSLFLFPSLSWIGTERVTGVMMMVRKRWCMRWWRFLWQSPFMFTLSYPLEWMEVKVSKSLFRSLFLTTPTDTTSHLLLPPPYFLHKYIDFSFTFIFFKLSSSNSYFFSFYFRTTSPSCLSSFGQRHLNRRSLTLCTTFPSLSTSSQWLLSLILLL